MSARPACVEIPNEQKFWFYEKHWRLQEKAKAICLECPVRQECLDRAMEDEANGIGTFDGKRFGIWGGLSAAERTELARKTA